MARASAVLLAGFLMAGTLQKGAQAAVPAFTISGTTTFEVWQLVDYSVYSVCILPLPVAFMFSILRYRLWDIDFIINTPSGKIPREHEVVIRNAALAAKIPIMTTVRAALASANGIRSLQKRKVQVRSLQEYHK